MPEYTFEVDTDDVDRHPLDADATRSLRLEGEYAEGRAVAFLSFRPRRQYRRRRASGRYGSP